MRTWPSCGRGVVHKSERLPTPRWNISRWPSACTIWIWEPSSYKTVS